MKQNEINIFIEEMQRFEQNLLVSTRFFIFNIIKYTLDT